MATEAGGGGSGIASAGCFSSFEDLISSLTTAGLLTIKRRCSLILTGGFVARLHAVEPSLLQEDFKLSIYHFQLIC